VPGPPGAPALLLLHGWTATAALNWYGSLEYLGSSFRAVAPNLRGHGRQGRGAPPFSFEGCADDLAALAAELGLERVTVVGYSMGGAVAQVLARRHRELVNGVVLCATASSFAEELPLRPAVRAAGRLAAGAARRWPRPAARFLAWRVDRHDQAVARRRVLGTTGVTGSGRAQPEWALAERSLSDLAAFIEAGAALNAFNSSEWLPGLRVPAAVVVTALDTTVAPWRQEALAALLPGARRYVVAAGHDAVVTKPDAFLPVLSEACSVLAERP
jgi:pimeloyl-ACP methyl ester carboxylesterase